MHLSVYVLYIFTRSKSIKAVSFDVFLSTSYMRFMTHHDLFQLWSFSVLFPQYNSSFRFTSVRPLDWKPSYVC